MARIVYARVTPGARKEHVVFDGVDTFTLAVRELAEGNRANVRVRELIAAHFGISRSAVTIEAGHHAQKKRVRVDMDGA